MAHPTRYSSVTELLERCHASVVYDTKRNEWDTARRALLAYDPWSTHHLVLQDDAILCQDLLAGITRALKHVPSRSPVCLYVGRKRPMGNRLPDITANADKVGASWLVMRDINWGVGIVFPTAEISALVEECDSQSVNEYDARVSGYFARRSIPVYYTWPSLVDHKDGPSLLKGRASEGRTAYRFIGKDASALDVDWSGPVVTVASPETTTFRSATGKLVSVAKGSPAERRYRKRTSWTQL